MIVKKVKLSGFRNLDNFEINFSSGKNLIHGPNGVGKTSVLESIFYCTFGRSFLSTTNTDILKRGSSEFNICTVAEDRGYEKVIKINYKNKIKTVLLNSNTSNIREVRDILFPVYFSSSSFTQEINSITCLRRLLDRFIFGVNSLYIHHILSYNRALRQKNHLLKKKPNMSDLYGWNIVLSQMGEKITKCRQAFVKELNKEIGRFDLGRIKVTYQPSLNTERLQSANSISHWYENLFEHELKYKRTLTGPHLDRYQISVGNEKLKNFSSGEKKISLLLIYVSFIKYFKRVNGEYPVFLVDDYDTAMDKKNRDFLFDSCPDMQVIATSVNTEGEFDHMVELLKEN